MTACLFDRCGQLGAVRAVVDRDDSQQVGAARIEPPPIQHRRYGQRRRRGILDLALGAAPVRTMPAPASRHPIHHMRCPQQNAALGQRLPQRVAELPIFLVASRTLRAVGVHDHCDRGIGFGCRRDLSEMLDPVEQPDTEVNPHDGPQLAVLQRHQNQ